MALFPHGVFLSIVASTASVGAWSPRAIYTARPSATKLYSSNIVLEPSDDPAAFDSLKIGSARVHRYSLDTDPDSQTEYVMWYHGR